MKRLFLAGMAFAMICTGCSRTFLTNIDHAQSFSQVISASKIRAPALLYAAAQESTRQAEDGLVFSITCRYPEGKINSLLMQKIEDRTFFETMILQGFADGSFFSTNTLKASEKQQENANWSDTGGDLGYNRFDRDPGHAGSMECMAAKSFLAAFAVNSTARIFCENPDCFQVQKDEDRFVFSIKDAQQLTARMDDAGCQSWSVSFAVFHADRPGSWRRFNRGPH